MVQSLKDLGIAGPFPIHESQLFFSTPRNALLQSSGPAKCSTSRSGPPRSITAKAPTYPNNLQPCLPPVGLREASKPPPTPQWWPAKQFFAWLADTGETQRKIDTEESGFLSQHPATLERMFESIRKPAHPPTEICLLLLLLISTFRPASCCAAPAFSVALRVTAPSDSPLCNHLNPLDALHPLGGERRVAHWRRDKTTADRWACPAGIIEAIGRKPQQLRLILATPAIFAKGWRPGWLQPINEGFVGKPPSENVKPGPQLKLVGAVVGRWQPISGWSLEAGKRGIKPLRRLAPAGSVFFFEVLDGSNPANWVAAHWLSSVCNDAQDRRDGFGLAAWGIWSPHNLSP